MGLVDYSDSESEAESVQQKPTPATAAAPTKKPFQKLFDRSSGAGKIVVNLPAAGSAPDASAHDEQPPAKRVKVTGGSRFSSLGSFLPPPRKTGAAAATAASRMQAGSTPAPGVHLRTGAEPAFIRGGGEENTTEANGDGAASSDRDLPATHSKARPGPSIPEGQKPEDEVKLVGKPLMFKPLSVARKKTPAKNKKKDTTPAAAGPSLGAAVAAPQSDPTKVKPATTISTAPPQKKKISLFSIGDEEVAPAALGATGATGTYEPLFTSTENQHEDEVESDVTAAYPTYQQYHQQQQELPPAHHQQAHEADLSSLASTLSPAARRELFGRSSDAGAALSSVVPPNARVISFDMEREYAHNEALRQSGAGAQLAYNPVRSIAPGKHSLRQVVNMAQSNREALEESFARAKGNQRDAAGRYGW
ncbi:mitotic checkpoint regulator, MAD2B-interacting-domain-containing protein [Corynascus novoguineensis]|uniref:Mitotic checkpoint regulator, MAD2B-interacting-domain-containing protein n=1 Tax=Corynascus novoguineensis TaxID=1126955 RepID=A0AAN7D222_9PEZI|nr:mitotic checkpoint regulator, MAD2B-interacting-domain-containing protein [Corynascus novoguineensis]